MLYFFEEERVKKLAEEYIKKNPEGYDYHYDIEVNNKTFADCFKQCIEEAENNQGSYVTPIETSLRNDAIMNILDDAFDAFEDDFYGQLSSEDEDLVRDFLEDKPLNLEEFLRNEGFAGINYEPDIITDGIEVNLLFETPCALNQDRCSLPSTLRDVVDGCTEELSDYTDRLNKEPAGEQDKHFDNILTYMVHQQGYTMAEFASVFYGEEKTESPFLNSLASAYEETLCNRAELAVTIEIGKDDFSMMEELAKAEAANTTDFEKNYYKPGYNDMDSLIEKTQRVLTIQPSEGIFFHDRTDGGGSGLEITLEKPLQIPLEMLDLIQIEEGRGCGYTVNEVYDGANRSSDAVSIEGIEDLTMHMVHESTEEIIAALSDINAAIAAREDVEYRAEQAAKFIQTEGIEIETVSANDYMLFDREAQDYRLDDYDKPEHFSSFEEIVANLDARVQERLMDLEDAAEDFEEFAEREMPSSPEEWAEHFNENPKSEFSRVYQSELMIMDTIAAPSKVNLEMVCKELYVDMPTPPKDKADKAIEYGD